MRALVLLALLAVLLLPAPLPEATTQPAWKEFDFNSRHFIVYDFDSDGVNELLALPSYVIDNYVALRSPYPQADAAFTVDLNLDGRQELVLRHLSTYYVFTGMHPVTSYLLHGQLVLDPYGRAFAVGNSVVYNMTVVKYADATSPVFPITTSNTLYAVYLSGGSIKIADARGWTVSVPSGGMVSVLGVGLYAGQFYVLGKVALGGSLLVVYDAVSGTARYSGFSIDFDGVVTFIPLTQEFIVTYGEAVYRVGVDRAVLEYIGRVLWFDGAYIYIYREQQNAIDVYSPFFKETLVTLPVPARPEVFGGRYPLVGFSDGARTYVLVFARPVSVHLSYPSVVYAGERFFYSLTVHNAVDYSILFNGQPVPPSGYLAVNASGVYKFIVSAFNGVTVETREYTLRVLPRPLHVSIYVDGVTRAYSRVAITVRAMDRLTGVAVEGLSCTLRLGERETVSVESWRPLQVELLPESLSKSTITIEAVCGDGVYYSVTRYSGNIHLYPVVASPHVEYLGEGTIRVRLLAPDGETEAIGTVMVYVNDRYVGSLVLPATITRLPAGNNTIRLVYIPGSPLFQFATYVLNVTYYEDVTAVPPALPLRVIVADVVKYVNVTHYVEVPTPTPVYVKETVEVPVLDTKLLLISVGVSATLGVAVGLLAPRLIRRPARLDTSDETVSTEPA